MVVRRVGAYDMPRQSAEQTQTVTLSPNLVGVAGADVLPFDEPARTVVAGETGYVQMERWPASLQGKWLRHPVADPGQGEDLHHAQTSVLPLPLDMLKSVGTASRDGTGDTAYVTVPAAAAFLAFPTAAPRG